MKKAAALITLLSILAFFGLAWLEKGYSPLQVATFFNAPSRDQLREKMSPVVSNLESWKRVHGSYPKSLNDAGCEEPDTFYGKCIYTVQPDGLGCCLVAGNYARYGFEYAWCSDDGWYYDS